MTVGTKCCRCGLPASFFTDTYDPNGGKVIVYLCSNCQSELFTLIREFTEGKDGVLNIEQCTDLLEE